MSFCEDLAEMEQIEREWHALHPPKGREGGEMAEKCSGYVDRGWGTHSDCLYPGKVERDGMWYCGIHDPARLEKRDAEYRARIAADNEARGRAVLIAQLKESVVETAKAWGNCPSAGNSIALAEAVKALRKAESK